MTAPENAPAAPPAAERIDRIDVARIMKGLPHRFPFLMIDRVVDFEHRDPLLYVNECSNGIFSLLKKEYAAPRVRALAATARRGWRRAANHCARGAPGAAGEATVLQRSPRPCWH